MSADDLDPTFPPTRLLSPHRHARAESFARRRFLGGAAGTAGAVAAGALLGPARALADTSDRIDVKMFGAHGDGVKNDTAAIQATLDAASSGGTVHIPAGTYMISAPLVLYDKVHLKGDGHASIIKAKTGFAGNANGSYLIDSYLKQQVIISDLAFDPATLADGAILIANGGSGNTMSSVDRCRIATGALYGIVIGKTSDNNNGTSGTWIRHSLMYGSPTGSQAAVVMNWGDSFMVGSTIDALSSNIIPYGMIISASGCKIWSCHIHHGREANVFIPRGGDISLVGNWIDGIAEAATGVLVQPAAGVSVIDLLIEGNYFQQNFTNDDTSSLVKLDNPNATTLTDIYVVGNHAQGKSSGIGFKAMVETTANVTSDPRLVISNNSSRWCNRVLSQAAGSWKPFVNHANFLKVASTASGLVKGGQYVSTNRGSAALPGATSTLNIAHGLPGIPTSVSIAQSLQGASQPTIAVDITNITLTWATAPGAETIYWTAWL